MIERSVLILVLALVFAAGLFVAGIYVGKSSCERAYAEREVERIKADAKIVDKLRVEGDKREVIYRDRIKTVRETVDNCLSQPIADPVLGQLRNATGSAQGSPSH